MHRYQNIGAEGRLREMQKDAYGMTEEPAQLLIDSPAPDSACNYLHHDDYQAQINAGFKEIFAFDFTQSGVDFCAELLKKKQDCACRKLVAKGSDVAYCARGSHVASSSGLPSRPMDLFQLPHASLIAKEKSRTCHAYSVMYLTCHVGFCSLTAA